MAALLYHFSLVPALWCCGVASYVGAIVNLVIGDDLMRVPGLYAPAFASMIDGSVSQFYQCCEAFVPIAFLVTLFTSHNWWGRGATTVFLGENVEVL